MQNILLLIFLLSSSVVFAQSAEDYYYTEPTPINAPGETSYSTYNNDWYEEYGRHTEVSRAPTSPNGAAAGAFAGASGGNINQSPVSGAGAGAVAGGGLASQIPTGCGPEGNGYRLCVPIPGVPQTIRNGLVEYISLIYTFALSIGGLVVFIMIVWGGIEYVVYAGNASKIEEAKDRIFNAVIGLLLLALSYIILSTINPELIYLKEPGDNTPNARLPAVSQPTNGGAPSRSYFINRPGGVTQ